MTSVNSIKKIGLFFLLFLFSTSISAQIPHFIYIQSDNSQAFYVRLNNKVFSSSEIGFLIIPKLQSGKMSVIIGFPMNKWNVMNYNLEVQDKDLSLLLKKVDSSNWELYDDLSKQTVSKNKTNQQQEIIENNNDEFSNILAEVSNNPKIKQTRKVIQTKDSSNLKLNTKIKLVENVDSKIVIVESTQTEKVRSKKSEKKKERQRIQKDFSYIDSTGYLIKYIISDEEKNDTISIFIPFPKQIENDKIEIPKISTVENLPKEVSVKQFSISQATEKDFLQLRKQMILEENEETMIEISEKAFQSLSYTTEMAKNLSVLFLKEKNRLTFLINAFKYVSDKQNFKPLSTLLTEENNLIQFNHLFE
jgi:hypothetical protein